MHAICDFVQRSHPSEEIAKSKSAEMGAGEEPNFKIKIIFLFKKICQDPDHAVPTRCRTPATELGARNGR